MRSPGHKSNFITQDYVLALLRKTCKDFGGQSQFGFNPMDIGNKSIRSGAAMALWLKDHSLDKIMILRRWRFKAFLDYIRLQVVEWINLVSSDMIAFNNFFKMLALDNKKKKAPEPNQSHFYMPALLTDKYKVQNGGAWVLETEYYRNQYWNQAWTETRAIQTWDQATNQNRIQC